MADIVRRVKELASEAGGVSALTAILASVGPATDLHAAAAALDRAQTNIVIETTNNFLKEYNALVFKDTSLPQFPFYQNIRGTIRAYMPRVSRESPKLKIYSAIKVKKTGETYTWDSNVGHTVDYRKVSTEYTDPVSVLRDKVKMTAMDRYTWHLFDGSEGMLERDENGKSYTNVDQLVEIIGGDKVSELFPKSQLRGALQVSIQRDGGSLPWLEAPTFLDRPKWDQMLDYTAPVGVVTGIAVAEDLNRRVSGLARVTAFTGAHRTWSEPIRGYMLQSHLVDPGLREDVMAGWDSSPLFYALDTKAVRSFKYNVQNATFLTTGTESSTSSRSLPVTYFSAQANQSAVASALATMLRLHHGAMSRAVVLKLPISTTESRPLNEAILDFILIKLLLPSEWISRDTNDFVNAQLTRIADVLAASLERNTAEFRANILSLRDLWANGQWSPNPQPASILGGAYYGPIWPGSPGVPIGEHDVLEVPDSPTLTLAGRVFTAGYRNAQSLSALMRQKVTGIYYIMNRETQLNYAIGVTVPQAVREDLIAGRFSNAIGPYVPEPLEVAPIDILPALHIDKASVSTGELTLAVEPRDLVGLWGVVEHVLEDIITQVALEPYIFSRLRGAFPDLVAEKSGFRRTTLELDGLAFDSEFAASLFLLLKRTGSIFTLMRKFQVPIGSYRSNNQAPTVRTLKYKTIWDRVPIVLRDFQDVAISPHFTMRKEFEASRPVQGGFYKTNLEPPTVFGERVIERRFVEERLRAGGLEAELLAIANNPEVRSVTFNFPTVIVFKDGPPPVKPFSLFSLPVTFKLNDNGKLQAPLGTVEVGSSTDEEAREYDSPDVLYRKRNLVGVHMYVASPAAISSFEVTQKIVMSAGRVRQYLSGPVIYIPEFGFELTSAE